MVKICFRNSDLYGPPFSMTYLEQLLRRALLNGGESDMHVDLKITNFAILTCDSAEQSQLNLDIFFKEIIFLTFFHRNDIETVFLLLERLTDFNMACFVVKNPQDYTFYKIWPNFQKLGIQCWIDILAQIQHLMPIYIYFHMEYPFCT